MSLESLFEEAFERQKKLLEADAANNKKAHESFLTSIRSGATLTYRSEVQGPYTKITTYYTSDGKEHTVVSASSLRWISDTILFRR